MIPAKVPGSLYRSKVPMNSVKIPVWLAVLMNANIVIGSAFFLGAGKIAAATGMLAPITWILCGILLLPLVLIFSHLALRFPQAGGIYVYSKECLGSLWGFISGWGYYIGVVAANAAVLHAFSSELQKIHHVNQFLRSVHINGLFFDVGLIVLFTIFNLFNIEFLERMQLLFISFKSIPLLLIMLSLPFLSNISHVTEATPLWSGLLTTLPWVFFAYIGVEACCAIADKIEGGARNASRVILISFCLIISIYSLLQLALLMIHGSMEPDLFTSILPKLTSNNYLISWGNGILSFAILSSFLGGFYGMFYYNNWNLYAIGQDKSIIGADHLVRVNKNQVPWVCVIIQSAILIFFLLITSHDYYLIAMSDFGTTIAYFSSVIAFLTFKKSALGLLALVSCTILLYICGMNLVSEGLYYIIPFGIVLVGGLFAHLAVTNKNG